MDIILIGYDATDIQEVIRRTHVGERVFIDAEEDQGDLYSVFTEDDDLLGYVPYEHTETIDTLVDLEGTSVLEGTVTSIWGHPFLKLKIKLEVSNE